MDVLPFLPTVEALYLLFRSFIRADALDGVVSTSNTSAMIDLLPASQSWGSMGSIGPLLLPADLNLYKPSKSGAETFILYFEMSVSLSEKVTSIGRTDCTRWSSEGRCSISLLLPLILNDNTRLGQRVILLLGQSQDTLCLSTCLLHVSALGYDKRC